MTGGASARFVFFAKKIAKLFGGLEILSYLCTRKTAILPGNGMVMAG